MNILCAPLCNQLVTNIKKCYLLLKAMHASLMPMLDLRFNIKYGDLFFFVCLYYIH